MIVDDNIDVIVSLKYGLEDQTKEYQVIGAESGKQCLEILQLDPIPDIIILDIMMPGMSGWDVFNRIKKKNGGIIGVGDHPERKAHVLGTRNREHHETFQQGERPTHRPNEKAQVDRYSHHRHLWGDLRGG